MTGKLIYLAFDHLNRSFGALRDASPKTDSIVIVESARMLQGRSWNEHRLHFLVSSARHFARELSDEGFEVLYLRSANTAAGIAEAQKKFPAKQLVATEPSSYRQSAQLQKLGAEFVANDFFLTPRALFVTWAESQKSYLMENFYRKQRIRLDVLMNGAEPEGGQFNFDAENRLPPPKNHQWPKYRGFELDEIDLEVAKQLNMQASGLWATSRAGALRRLGEFLDEHFAGFGPYEDATSSDSWSMHHSLLSPYLNNGLLHPGEVVQAAVNKYRQGEIPIASAEGFIRQIIGWREYINGMYWFLGEDYRERNGLAAKRKLLPLFVDPEKTQMNCVKSEVQAVQQRGWTHHIPRLMILSNLALLTGTNPQQFLDWMREQFVDAADWVMVPNVIGMGVHADGGTMMTKPYAAGGAYIARMTNYCKGCGYDPKLRVGANACPFTTLYWDFLDRNLEAFSKNHRMSQQIGGLKRLSDLAELKDRAGKVLVGLEAGEI